MRSRQGSRELRAVVSGENGKHKKNILQALSLLMAGESGIKEKRLEKSEDEWGGQGTTERSYL